MKTVDKLEAKRVNSCTDAVYRLEDKKKKIMERYPQDCYGNKGLDMCYDIDREIEEVVKYRNKTMVAHVEEAQKENLRLQAVIGKLHSRLCELCDREEADLILKRNGVKLRG